MDREGNNDNDNDGDGMAMSFHTRISRSIGVMFKIWFRVSCNAI